MPCWYWDKKDLENSPSRKAGVTPENENRYRREGARFIYKLGQGMKLHHDTLASAAVFYHRFYQIHSFFKFRSRYVTATCCLFLAGKVEETPKKWTDLIKGARSILAPAQFQQFGTMEDAKDELMAMERVLLQTIKFDFNIEHAHKFIIQYCEELRSDLEKSIDEEKIKEMVQQSWNFANDSYYTNLCLQWEPQVIAICMIYLAGKIQKVEALGYKTLWWEKFIPDLDRDLIESVCHQVLDIYSKPNTKKASATPAKGATPAKKAKLSDGQPASTPSTPQSDVQKQLQSLLKSVPTATIKTVMESSKSQLPTPAKTPTPIHVPSSHPNTHSNNSHPVSNSSSNSHISSSHSSNNHSSSGHGGNHMSSNHLSGGHLPNVHANSVHQSGNHPGNHPVPHPPSHVLPNQGIPHVVQYEQKRIQQPRYHTPQQQQRTHKMIPQWSTPQPPNAHYQQNQNYSQGHGGQYGQGPNQGWPNDPGPSGAGPNYGNYPRPNNYSRGRGGGRSHW